MAMVLSIASGVIGAIGDIQEANAKAQADRYNAQIADNNAQIAGQNAARSAADKRRETRQRIGAVVAATGANGFTMSGSPLDVLEETAANGELDALTIQYNGQNTAQGYRNDAVLSRKAADNDITTGYFNAAGTLLGGISKGLSMGGSFAGAPVGVS